MPPLPYTVGAPPTCPLGETVPYKTPHAVSVSLPRWVDCVDYEEGHPRIADAMSSGYPRFYIHHRIQQLAAIATARLGLPGESCILLPTLATATDCKEFLASRSPPVASRIATFLVRPAPAVLAEASRNDPNSREITVFPCFFSADDFPIAKQFWQHTGDGIQSRVAERCLILLGEVSATDAGHASSVKVAKPVAQDGTHVPTRTHALPGLASQLAASGPPHIDAPRPSYKNRYASKTVASLMQRSESQTRGVSHVTSPESHSASPVPFQTLPASDEENYLSLYVEERYARNLDLSLAPLAKVAMRRRIAGVLRETPGRALPVREVPDAQHSASSRGVSGLTEDDVYLYPTGMSAIYHSFRLLGREKAARGEPIGKSVCFGFPYTDTLKILEKWGPGCHFLGRGLSADLAELRRICTEASPPILALYCEFPSNPLLRSPPVDELRALSAEFGFAIVIDETIAGFVNAELLPKADIVVSSLTKVFSGDSNVMGGSLVLNPASPRYAGLHAAQKASYEDFYFDEDAIFMERNSRDFPARIARENESTEVVCDFLISRRISGDKAISAEGLVVPRAEDLSKSLARAGPYEAAHPPVITNVFYPKYMTPENYKASFRPPTESNGYASGFGALFSVTFVSAEAAIAFYDNLPCYKGPSLGTNFTLACPYTILAHYMERDWAAGWGVDANLVRVAVGLEDLDMLLQWIKLALSKAEEAEALRLSKQ